MCTLKRSREGGDICDIRSFFQRAQERDSLRRRGPFCFERILSSRLVSPHCRPGAVLLDPTRLCGERNSGTLPCHGVRALSQRIEAAEQLRGYKQLNQSALRVVVPPDQNTSTFSPVTDIVFDMQEQFALVCQSRRFSAYSIDKWLDSNNYHHEMNGGGDDDDECGSPLVRVDARGWRRVGVGFSALQFISSSLHIVAGYHHAPVVDIFDLEDVDEETCEPQQRFSLSGSNADIHDAGGSSMSTSSRGGAIASISADAESAYANDVVAVTEHVSLAALSSGRAVWLDRRSGTVTTCTGMYAREYNIGRRDSLVSKNGPLTSVAFLCRDDPINVLCGTQTGAVQLWDVRCTRDYVAVHQTSSPICRLQVSYAASSRNILWLNNYGGEVHGINVGQSEMRLIAKAKCADTVRSTATFHLPLPRLSVLDPPGLIACPHISSNALMLLDVSTLTRKTCIPKVRDVVDGGGDDGNLCSGGSIDDDDDRESPLRQNAMDPHAPAPLSSAGEDKVQTIPFNNFMSCEDLPNISACGVWTKYGRIVVGDAKGSVRLA